MSDRLTLTRAFEGAGLKSGDAERIATEIYDAIHDNVATKADVVEVNTSITALRAEVKAEIAELRAEVKAEIVEVKTEIAELRAATKADLRDLEQRLKIRLGSLIVAAVGALFAALHYWPPH